MKKIIFPFWMFTLLSVFFLSYLWEFHLEDRFSFWILTDHASESASDKWDFIGIVLFFSGLALIAPTLWSLREIKKQETLNNALSETQIRYQNLFSTISDPILILDAESNRFEDVNEAAVKQYEFSREEFLKLSPKDISAEPEKTEKAIQENLQGNLKKIPLRYHKTKTGQVFPAELTAGRFKVKDKNKVFAIVHNISERKQIEELLIESEARYRTVYHQLSSIVSGTAPATTGEIFFKSLVSNLASALNVQYATICTYKKGSRNIFRTLVFYKQGEFLKSIEYELKDTPCNIVVRGEIVAFPNEVQAHFPKDIFFKENNIQSYVGYPIRNGEGKTTGILSIMDTKPIQDIESAKSILSIFASRVGAEMQRMSAEAKRAENAEKLQESNRELQDFVSIASHDLQEPLRKIVTFGDRLGTVIPESNPKARDYLTRMQKSAARMQTFLGDLLQYSKLGTKKVPFKPTDLNEVVRDVLQDLDVKIKENKGTVNLRKLPVLEADPFQMRQLFLNLIANGLKFHRENVPPVVNLDSRLIKEGVWEISVEDNGIGIDEKHADRIFRPFERLHNRSTYEGTGIGLTICNKIVSRHHGKIEVRRQPDQGVAFHILLPEKQTGQRSDDAFPLIASLMEN